MLLPSFFPVCFFSLVALQEPTSFVQTLPSSRVLVCTGLSVLLFFLMFLNSSRTGSWFFFFFQPQFMFHCLQLFKHNAVTLFRSLEPLKSDHAEIAPIGSNHLIFIIEKNVKCHFLCGVNHTWVEAARVMSPAAVNEAVSCFFALLVRAPPNFLAKVEYKCHQLLQVSQLQDLFSCQCRHFTSFSL